MLVFCVLNTAGFISGPDYFGGFSITVKKIILFLIFYHKLHISNLLILLDIYFILFRVLVQNL